MAGVFSVDLEDWYHGIELPFDSWSKYEVRIEKGFNKVYELLEESNVKATFFTLGWVAEKYPHIIKKLSDSGHELASHGYSHEKVYDLSPEDFREEIRRTKGVLENLTGQEVIAHRSPYFSITSQSLWALKILREEGYLIDSSISPIKTWRYGISTCPDHIFKVKEADIIEFPISHLKLLTKKWAIGGAYFRLLPSQITINALKKREKSGKSNMFYIHPWEYDASHPKVDLDRKAKFTHYTNLKKTYRNTQKMLSELEFTTISSYINNYKKENDNIEEISLEVLKD